MRIYATDLTDAQWALVDSIIPEGKPGDRPRSIDVRAVVNAIFYLLRTGCQWRLLPREFPPWPTGVLLLPALGARISLAQTPALVLPSCTSKSGSPCDSFGCYLHPGITVFSVKAFHSVGTRVGQPPTQPQPCATSGPAQ
jgi:hypothetical protein